MKIVPASEEGFSTASQNPGGTILSPKSAESLGCRPFGRGTGFRHDGGRVDLRRAGPVDLSIGDYRRHGEVGVLDLDQFLAGLPPVGGIISLESFAGRAMTVDLSNGKLIVEDAASLAERAKNAQEIKIRIARPAAGAGLDVFVAVDGRNGPHWFELDSGNVAPVLLAPHTCEELGIAFPAGKKTVDVRLPISGFSPIKATVAVKENSDHRSAGRCVRDDHTAGS